MVRQAVRQAHGPEQSRRTHHLTTLSQVEGQITMTEIQNSKQLAFDLIFDRTFNLQFPDKTGFTLRCNPGGGISAALRPACPGWEGNPWDN